MNRSENGNGYFKKCLNQIKKEKKPSSELQMIASQRLAFFDRLDQSVFEIMGTAYFVNLFCRLNGSVGPAEKDDLTVAGLVWRSLSDKQKSALWQDINESRCVLEEDAVSNKTVKNRLRVFQQFFS